MKLGLTVFITFCVILILFSFNTYLIGRQNKLFESTESSLETSAIVVKMSNRFQRNFLSMVSGLRGYLLTNETSFIQTYDSALADNKEIKSELSRLISINSEQRILLDDINELQKYWVNEFATPLILSKKSSMVSDNALMSFNKLYGLKLETDLDRDVQRSLQSKFQEFIQYEYDIRKSQAQMMSGVMSFTHKVALYSSVVTILAGIGISSFLAWYVSSRARRIVSMAKAISDGNYKVTTHAEGRNEFSQIGKALNNMALVLKSNFAMVSKQRDELDEYAHIISQTLKGPLKGVQNAVTSIKTCKSVKINSDLVKYLADIEDKIHKAESLINGLLSNAGAGRTEHYKEVVEVDDILKDIRSYLPRDTQIALITQQTMPVLYTEKLLLHQIFTNLIMNAVTYASHCKIEVCVYYKEDGDMYHFFVQHTLSPLENPSRQRMFLNFDGMKTLSDFSEAAIGLSIVNKIINERGLDIRMNIEPGKRFVFCFEWPKNETNEAYHQYSSNRG